METGLTITAIGMTVVFVLLTALVGIIQAMSKLAAALEPPAPPAAKRQTGAATHADDNLIPAIAAAISVYRRKHRTPGN